MKKDIEWLKEAVGDLNLVDTVFEADGVSDIDTAVSMWQVIGLINQLDEPEKVVVPKVVAEWYEEEERARYLIEFKGNTYELKEVAE